MINNFLKNKNKKFLYVAMKNKGNRKFKNFTKIMRSMALQVLIKFNQ